jgi:2-oxoglutarate ferredoxin oxidoreductase subunit gamma
MIRILLAGEGGQGIQTVAKIITIAAQLSGRKTTYIPSFGVEQRGGVSLAYIQIDQENIPFPRFDKADIVVSFCDRAIAVVKNFIRDDTLFIYDNSAIHTDILEQIAGKIQKYVCVPAQKLAQEKFTTKVLNMILLGALSVQLKDINYQKIEDAVNTTLGEKMAKDEKIKEMNFGAIHEGITLAESFDQSKCELSGKEREEIQQEFSDDKKTWTRFPQYCKGCALCITRCPVKALQFTKDVGFLGNPIPIVDINKCIACELCEKTCPDGAIKVDKK